MKNWIIAFILTLDERSLMIADIIVAGTICFVAGFILAWVMFRIFKD